MGITWSDLSISSTSKGNGKKPDITGPGKTLCQTRTIAMIEDQDQTSLRHGQCIQTRLQSDAIPLSVLRALRPIIDPPAPCTLRDMEMFIHDFRVEWLLLQTEVFIKYFVESEDCAHLESQGRAAGRRGCTRIYSSCSGRWNGARHRSSTITPCPRPDLRDGCLGRVKRTVMSSKV